MGSTRIKGRNRSVTTFITSGDDFVTPLMDAKTQKKAVYFEAIGTVTTFAAVIEVTPDLPGDESLDGGSIQAAEIHLDEDGNDLTFYPILSGSAVTDADLPVHHEQFDDLGRALRVRVTNVVGGGTVKVTIISEPTVK